jgi:hypothetical protein
MASRPNDFGLDYIIIITDNIANCSILYGTNNTGLDLSSNSLFWAKFSSLYTYWTPFSAKAMQARCPNELTQKLMSITPFSDAIDANL